MKNLILLLTILFSIQTQAEVLTIWTSSENVKEAISSLSSDFEKKYEIKIQIDVLNKDLTTQFKTAAMTGKGPDILCWAHDVVGELAESGLIEPLDLTNEFKSKFIETAIRAYTYKGKIYGYPYDIESLALIYNKDIIKTPPSTMKELLEYAQKNNQPTNNKYSFLYDIKSFFFSFPIFASNGGYIFNETKEGLNINDVGLANKGAVKTTNLLLKLIEDKIIPASTDRSIAFSKMKEGKLAMTIDGPWAIEELKKSKINYGIATIPTVYGNKAKPFVGTHGFIIRRSSKNKDIEKEFIENHLVSKDGIISLYKKDPRGPSRKDALTVLAKTNPDLVSFFQSATDGIPMPNVPQMGAVWSAMGSSLSLIFSKRSEVKPALEQAVKQIENSVKAN